MNMHRNTRRVLEAAASKGLELEVLHFPQGTRTAADAAAAIGCEVGAIVKSLLLMSDGGPVMALTSGANRVAYDRVGELLGEPTVRRADADEVRAATGFPIGGTSPLGVVQPLRTLFDRALLGYDRVWAAAGTPDTVFGLEPARLVEVTGAVVTDIAAP